MNERPILSLFIVTYNRKEILLDKIRHLLEIKSDDFDVLIRDDMSTDGTADVLKAIGDSRVRVFQNKDGVMQNWYHLLEMCDGQFAFHLNDRDLIDTDGIGDLIQFLREHPTMTGGICNIGGGKLLESPEECFMSILYFGSHPTGIVFNIDEYRLVQNRQKFFTREAAYIHPHDLIWGKLAEYGEMFQFKRFGAWPEQSRLPVIKVFCTKKEPSKMRGSSRKRELRNFACLSSRLQIALLIWN